jgi:Arc/MetJ family transcription regulator
MKMTMHIDETILDEVMEAYGCTSKTEAVDFALRELLRKRKLREFGKSGLGLTPEELADAVLPGYDPLALRAAESLPPYGEPPAGR